MSKPLLPQALSACWRTSQAEVVLSRLNADKTMVDLLLDAHPRLWSLLGLSGEPTLTDEGWVLYGITQAGPVRCRVRFQPIPLLQVILVLGDGERLWSAPLATLGHNLPLLEELIGATHERNA